MSLRNVAAALAGTTIAVAPAAGGTPAPVVAAVYAEAARQAGCGVNPADLAAIQQVESPSAVLQPDGRATNPDGSPIVGDSGYSHGPFQFYELAGTWTTYGQGGDPNRLDDSAEATARMLCANGYATDRRSAIRRHNGSGPAAEAYADRVLAIAASVHIDPAASAPTGGLTEVDGLTLRVTDRLLGRLLAGWERLGRWVTGNRPDAVPVWQAVDREIGELTDPNPGADSPSSAPAPTVVGGVVCPVPGGSVLDGWGSPRSGGRTHQGVDIEGRMGQPVVSPFNGRVTETVDNEADGGLGGLAVWIEATDGPHKGVRVYLAHNRRNLVHVGQTVRQGDQVAELGDSGNARGTTAPHVHAQWHPYGGAPVPATPLENACSKEAQP